MPQTTPLCYKEDWRQCRDWTAAWLHGRVGEHWALGVLAPREHPLPAPAPPPPPLATQTRWLDLEWTLAQREALFAATYFGGIDFPQVTANLGPGSLSLFLGAAPHFMEDTVWHQPCFTDPANVELCLDPANPYWQWTLASLRQCVQAAAGKYLVALPELLDGLDVLAQLFGTEELLTFLVDCPQEIHRLLAQVEEIHARVYDACHAMVADDLGGNALPTYMAWGPGRTLVTQCDFSAMISPAMFAEFVVPYLERRCARMAYTIYHLDGPGAIRHLEQLVRVPALTAVEWTPGAGNPYAADPAWWDAIWRPVYAAGKSAHVWAVPTEQIRPFLEEFGQQGTLITTGCASEAEARQLIEESAHWGE